MSEQVVGMTIGADVIKPIIEAKIRAAIVEAMGGHVGLVERMVAETCRMKVRRDFRPDTTLLEDVLETAMREAITQAVKEWAENAKSQITKAFVEHMKSKKGTSAIVEAMLTGLTDCLAKSWSFQVNVNR